MRTFGLELLHGLTSSKSDDVKLAISGSAHWQWGFSCWTTPAHRFVCVRLLDTASIQALPIQHAL